MQVIHLDIAERGAPPLILAKQGDVGRKFRAVITDQGEPYPIPENAGLSVWYSGTSGEGNYSSVGGKSAFTVSGNTVEVELITQMLAIKGGGTLCLILSRADGTQIGFWNLPYIAEPVPGLEGAEATGYYTALSELLGQMLEAAATFETDETLTQSGMAADAEATGNALNGKAPTRYGLGEVIIRSCQRITDLNITTLRTGFYVCTALTENKPDDRFGGGPLFVLSWSDGQILFQILKNSNLTETYARRYMNGVWDDWVYLDPQMENRRVYLTGERDNEKPVYAIRVPIGALPNTNTSYTALGMTKENYPQVNLVDIRFNVVGSTRQYCNLQSLPEGNLKYFLYGNSSQWYFGVETAFDASAMTGSAIIKFTV